MLGTLMLILLVLMLMGVVPVWPRRREWGYRPSGARTLRPWMLNLVLPLGRI